jgi:hypothetical protein
VDHAAIAHRVLVFQRAAEHDGDDFHVAMRVHVEATARRHHVVVDDAQAAEAHVIRVVVIRKGKREPGVQPAVVGLAPLVGSSNRHHNLRRFLFSAGPSWAGSFHVSHLARERISRPIL